MGVEFFYLIENLLSSMETLALLDSNGYSVASQRCILSSRCRYCLNLEESPNHLFVDGLLARVVWQHYTQKFGILTLHLEEFSHYCSLGSYHTQGFLWAMFGFSFHWWFYGSYGKAAIAPVSKVLPFGLLM